MTRHELVPHFPQDNRAEEARYKVLFRLKYSHQGFLVLQNSSSPVLVVGLQRKEDFHVLFHQPTKYFLSILYLYFTFLFCMYVYMYVHMYVCEGI